MGAGPARLWSVRASPFALGLLALACDPNIVGTPLDSGLVPEDGGPLPDAGGADYPPGPYGTTVGDVLPNMIFAGYLTPTPAGAPVSGLPYTDPVTLADLRAAGIYRYLLLNVAAEWCVPCQAEAEVLPAKYTAWASKGGLVASVLTEDSNVLLATKRNLDDWIRAYDTNYTMLHDPRGEVSRILAPPTMPLNLVVDLTTMRILRRQTGDDPEVFVDFEARLDQR